MTVSIPVADGFYVGFSEIAFRTADVAGVPEPATFVLGGWGLLGVYFRKRLR